jgi:hypothetical protein
MNNEFERVWKKMVMHNNLSCYPRIYPDGLRKTMKYSGKPGNRARRVCNCIADIVFTNRYVHFMVIFFRI